MLQLKNSLHVTAVAKDGDVLVGDAMVMMLRGDRRWVIVVGEVVG